MSALGDCLKNIREQRKLSTIDIQKLSEGRISQSYVVQVEKGDKTPSVAKLEAFADVYGIEVMELVNHMLIRKKHDLKKMPFVQTAEEMRLIKQIRKMSEKKRKAFYSLFAE